MSKEAMKLRAAAEKVVELCSERPLSLGKWFIDMSEACESLREALAKPDFWEGYVPEPVKSGEGASATVTITLPAQQALDKKAENARELGLDYEPVCNKDPQGCWNVRCQLGKKCKNTSAQQEPVAWMSPHGGFLSANYINNFASGLDKEIHNIPLYTSPPAQRTWVGLTDAQNTVIWANSQSVDEAIRATEKQLMENNI